MPKSNAADNAAVDVTVGLSVIQCVLDGKSSMGSPSPANVSVTLTFEPITLLTYFVSRLITDSKYMYLGKFLFKFLQRFSSN